MDRVALSKTMSRALRHAPEEYGLELDAQGWVAIEALVQALRRRGRWRDLREEEVRAINGGAEKQRFEIEVDRIRARYGHSVGQRIEHEPAKPPAVLFHGTSERALGGIERDGLQPMKRQYVHLSTSTEGARRVGARHPGRMVVLAIDTAEAARQGVRFYRGGEDVWLAGAVPPQCLRVTTGAGCGGR